MSVQRDLEMAVGMVDFHKFPSDLDIDSLTLPDFPPHGFAKRFSAFLFAARKFPEPA